MDLKNATIAIVTDDGMTVSSHFGRAPFYEVVTLADGRIVNRMRREKAGHHTFAPAEEGNTHRHGQGDDHGQHHGPEHEARHRTMVSPILDCQAVIVRGMGQGAVDHVRQAGLLPVLTGLHTIDEVLGAIAGGSLDNDSRRIHQHHGQ